MTNITPRQELFLSLIVRVYVESPKKSGVSSKSIVENYELGISSATVRNEMAALTQAGLLSQPYTSAGRIPTEEGYRYFVQRLVSDEGLIPNERHLISHQFHQARSDVDQWSRLAASVLAQHTRGASLVTAPHSELARFKHLELISTRGRQVLMVLVLQGGEVRQQMLTFPEPVTQEQLTSAANRINAICENLSVDAVESQSVRLEELDREVLEVVAEAMRRADDFVSGEVYLDGLQNVLAEPEFFGTDVARPALRLLEERSYLDEFLGEVLTPQIGGVQVVIAGEGNWDDLQSCSVVLARYGVEDVATGALGVLGPTRMAYGRAMGAVRFVASLLTSLVYETYGQPDTGYPS